MQLKHKTNDIIQAPLKTGLHINKAEPRVRKVDATKVNENRKYNEKNLHKK